MGDKIQQIGTAYRVETERLVLRCWSPEDAACLRRILDANDQHLRPMIPFMKDEPRTLQQTALWLRGIRAMFDLDKNYRYAVFDRDESVRLASSQSSSNRSFSDFTLAARS